MKRKLLKLILWIITIQVLISGAFIAYVSWDTSIKSMASQHRQKMNYIDEALEITQSNGTFVNYHHFVQKMSKLKDVRVTLYSMNGQFLADSLDNTLLFQEKTKPEVYKALRGASSMTTRVDDFTKQLTYYSGKIIQGSDTQYVLILSNSIEPLKSELLLLLRHITLAIVVGIIISISAGYRFVERYTAPIIQLKESANTISSGQYEYELDTSATDEVGELADAFQSMTKSVKTAISELSESNAHMNAILQEMFGGVIGIDLNDEVFLVNPIAEEILDISFNKVHKKNYRSIHLPDSILHSIEEVKEKQHETKHRITLDNNLVLVVQNAPIRTENGDLIGYVIVMFDITEKTRLAQMQRELFTNVSHEIRTPLTSIQGFVETLEHFNRLSESDMRSIVDIMLKETNRLSGLINKMMEIAKLDNEEDIPEFEVADLNQVLKTVFTSHEHNALSKEISIELDMPEASLYVYLNTERFETVLSNLVSNAIKYTNHGGSIKIRAFTEGNYATISVTDSGIGIAVDDHDKVFQRFYRCDPSRNFKVPGYGLGLHISKTLSDSMNLSLQLESEIGEGSTFTISHIPLFHESV